MWGAGLVSTEYANGLGRHEYYLPEAHILDFTFYGWLDWQQTFLTLTFTKVSICLFLLRITSGKWLVRGIHSLVAVLIVFHLIIFGLFCGFCRPLKTYWDKTVPGVCFSKHQEMHIILAQGVTDLILSTFPIFVLRRVQINFRTKVGLCVLMGLGIITAICCTVRTVLAGSLLLPDQTWSNTTQLAWRLPEVNMGIVCANAPILRPIYLALTGRLPTRTKSADVTEEAKSNTGAVQLSQDPEQRKWPSHSSRSGKRSASGRGSQGKPGGPLSSNDSHDIGLPIQINWRKSLGIPEKSLGLRSDGAETYLSSGSSLTFTERHVDDRV
ncbi:MAG: hypothetical protein M1836_001348 [Candelina mexicana]|nr:MAG: hypothetical protein M1836_001348 [Candelina mexicana]